MKRSLDRLCLACGLALVVMAAGCQASRAAVRKSGAEIDPCADRLHDICGRLLPYCAAHGRLPDDLDDLTSADSEPLLPLVCPVSGKPYVYDRDGLPVQGRAGRLVLYDAAPSHSGMRWAILADPLVEGKPLTARVILLPERPTFASRKQ